MASDLTETTKNNPSNYMTIGKQQDENMRKKAESNTTNGAEALARVLSQYDTFGNLRDFALDKIRSALTAAEQRGFERGASQQPMDAGDWKTVRDCIDHAINEDTGTPNEDRCLPAADAFYRIYAEHIAQRGKAETEILLPVEMPGCKIVFEECPVGHGELRATNWVKNECPWCKIKILESALSDNGKADVVPSGDAMELAKKCVKRLVDLYDHKDIEVIADYIQSAFNARDAAAPPPANKPEGA